MQKLKSEKKNNIKNWCLYVKKHQLIVKIGRSIAGCSRTFLGWVFVGFAVVSFDYAAKKTSIPGPIVLFYQSF